MQAELAYTLSKIERDFSNFSAWHQRQLLLRRMWAGSPQQKQADDVAQELELLLQAMYTDPSDQSVWLYHRWLVEQQPTLDVLQREIGHIEELLSIEPDAKCACVSSLCSCIAMDMTLTETRPGCMQSLVHYRSLRRAAAGCSAAQAHADAREEERLLRELVRVDPERRRRYEDELRARQHV